MIDISDFYVNLAGVSGTLLGTFVIGAFFYLDSDMHRRALANAVDDLYIRAGIRWVFAAYSLPVFVSLTLASLPRVYGAVVFAVLATVLLLTTVATARRVLAAAEGMSTSLVLNEWLTTAAVPVLIALPWILGREVLPSVEHYVPSLMLSLAIAFSSTAALVMAEFDSSMGDVRVGPRPDRGAAVGATDPRVTPPRRRRRGSGPPAS
ncbi:hypothetical protein [Microbacterium rhizophilus]|uniref:hypothetical protein n=1 Tax=Microbacterium rhizophilus TaxID=3138934 RepID=UPI0031F086A0